ncbi:hypothetical protein ACM66B_003063 [Microbotryomycetes sp. NB124-2]
MPPQVLPAAPSRSRSDPKPVLVTSRQWIVPERPKPGRKPGSGSAQKSSSAAQKRPPAPQKRISTNGTSSQGDLVADLRQKLRAAELSDHQTKRQLEHALSDNASLRQLVQELRRELSYVKSYSSAAADALRSAAAAEAAHHAYEADALDQRPTKRRRTSSVSSSSRSSSDRDTYSTHAPLSLSATSADHSPPLETTSMPTTCGLCQTDAECFCAQVSMQTTPSVPSAHDLIVGQAQTASAVPLRLRQSTTTPAKPKSVWNIVENAHVQHTSPVSQPVLCSGDPSNCPACSDDPFGKAFCESLSQSVSSTHPCKDCPGNCGPTALPSTSLPPTLQPLATQKTAADVEAETEASLFATLTDLPCCGDPAMCGSRTCEPSPQATNEVEQSTAVASGATAEEEEMLPRSVPRGVRTTSTDKIPCNEAWMTLKQHPNIAFADLQMLADVVAKRTHCEGPALKEQVSTSDATPPDTFALGRVAPAASQAQSSGRRLTVEKSAVREALAILDRAVAGRSGSAL